MSRFHPIPTLVSALVALALTASSALAWVSVQVPPAQPRSAVLQVATSVDEMPPEMRRAYITGIQEQLLEHGYKPGPVDGVMGSRTRQAIRRYQRDASLPVNGEATKEILDHLKFVQPKVYARAEVPQRSSLVFEIQEELRLRGYYHGAMDGLSGPLTSGSALRFQRDAGLPVTGKIDLLLLDDLKRADPAIRAMP